MTYPLLSSPFFLGELRLPNRVVMPPMVVWKAAEDGTVTPGILEHYAESTGPGLVVVEATVVSPEGRLARRQLGIFEDRHVEGLARIASTVHASGAAASIQIHHAGRNTNRENTFGAPILAPSAIPSRAGAEPPTALTEAEIERILEAFRAAAVRAADAGFDAIEIHGAHGYLVSQFLSPLANQRTDRWGGSLENRARFLREIVRRAREAAGTRLLVGCRLGVADGEKGGLPLEEGLQVARWIAEDGVGLIHVSNGMGGVPAVAPAGSPCSPRMHLAFAVKEAVRVPVIGVGDVRAASLAEEILASGRLDLVAVGRALLADPSWAAKSLAGREAEIEVCRACRACQQFGHAERCPAFLARTAR